MTESKIKAQERLFFKVINRINWVVEDFSLIWEQNSLCFN